MRFYGASVVYTFDFVVLSAPSGYFGAMKVTLRHMPCMLQNTRRRLPISALSEFS